ncbi:hypothetical protein GOP47_0009661 [Adiantum capillus-veneris]|uniref:Uncharacterized protein n=1 Tax=Adiantum capillus-veneris TaxID=13818 RepID=A0A9D4UWN6_ADICA|nr:hypothetical protein GOP47_0009661 [Adiantum capillus-veneris]
MAPSGSDSVLLRLIGEYNGFLCYRDSPILRYHDIALYYVRLLPHDHSTLAFQMLRASAHPTMRDHLIDSIEVLYRVQRVESRHEIVATSPEDTIDT